MIVINGKFLCQPTTGVQRVAAELSAALQQLRDDVVILRPRAPIVAIVAPEVASASIPVGSRTGALWEQRDLPAALSRLGNPTLISLANMGPISYANQVYFLHDVIFRRYPEGFKRSFLAYYNWAVPRLLRKSRQIVTVSEFSRREIAVEFGVRELDIAVAHNAPTPLSGCCTAEQGPADAAIGHWPRNPQFLAFYSSGRNKNFQLLSDAHDTYRRQGGAWELAVVGATNEGGRRSEGSAEGRGGVQWLGRVDERQLHVLYRESAVFVTPSEYEGFGLPPVEAQSHGCPVIASRTEVNAEILGASYMPFNTRSTESLAEALWSAETAPALMRDVGLRGRENARKFSWQASARALNELL